MFKKWQELFLRNIDIRNIIASIKGGNSITYYIMLWIGKTESGSSGKRRCRWSCISIWALSPPTALTIACFARRLKQGIIQHPHKLKITNRVSNVAVKGKKKPFHEPNHRSKRESMTHPLIPEFSANSSLRVCNPSSALVTDQPGALLLGMNVQHWSPLQTPPFSASIMSVPPSHHTCGLEFFS